MSAWESLTVGMSGAHDDRFERGVLREDGVEQGGDF